MVGVARVARRTRLHRDGITVGTDGFTGGVPNLVAWAAFIFFAVIATIAAWCHGRSDRPTEHQPAQDRLSRN